MQRIRRKGDRVVATQPAAATAHGRLARTAPAIHVRTVDQRDGRVRLVEALVLVRSQAAGIDVGLTPRALKARIDRARVELGPEAGKRLTMAFAETTGPMLATVKRAHADARPHAMRAACQFVILLDEHQVESTAAMALLASASQWMALGDLLRDRIFAQPSGEGMAAAVKMAAVAASTGRNDLLSALELEQRAKEGRPREWPQWTQPAQDAPGAARRAPGRRGAAHRKVDFPRGRPGGRPAQAHVRARVHRPAARGGDPRAARGRAARPGARRAVLGSMGCGAGGAGEQRQRHGVGAHARRGAAAHRGAGRPAARLPCAAAVHARPTSRDARPAVGKRAATEEEANRHDTTPEETEQQQHLDALEETRHRAARAHLDQVQAAGPVGLAVADPFVWDGAGFVRRSEVAAKAKAHEAERARITAIARDPVLLEAYRQEQLRAGGGAGPVPFVAPVPAQPDMRPTEDVIADALQDLGARLASRRRK